MTNKFKPKKRLNARAKAFIACHRRGSLPRTKQHNGSTKAERMLLAYRTALVQGEV